MTDTSFHLKEVGWGRKGCIPGLSIAAKKSSTPERQKQKGYQLPGSPEELELYYLGEVQIFRNQR
jgi:hypothetical protein